MPKLFWVGVTTLVVGCGPLFVIIVLAALHLTKDPNPNPVGPGLLAFLTFWPGVILTVIGWRRSRRGTEPPVLTKDS
jgi:hypothetical protein